MYYNVVILQVSLDILVIVVFDSTFKLNKLRSVNVS